MTSVEHSLFASKMLSRLLDISKYGTILMLSLKIQDMNSAFTSASIGVPGKPAQKGWKADDTPGNCKPTLKWPGMDFKGFPVANRNLYLQEGEGYIHMTKYLRKPWFWLNETVFCNFLSTRVQSLV